MLAKKLRPPVAMAVNPSLDAIISRAQNTADISTESDLDTALISLSKALIRNTQLRSKHPSNPALFLQSELQLHTALQSLSSVAAYPSLYPSLIIHGAPSHFIQLLAHPNDDMLCDVINLLYDLCVDVDDKQMRRVIHDAFFSHGILKAIVNSLRRLCAEFANNEDQTSHMEAQVRILSIFEDILDGEPSLALRLVNETGIMEACIPMVQAQGQQPVEATAELLAVLMQQGVQVCELFIDRGGFPVVLGSIEKLKGGGETVRNLMDVVCCLLLTEKGKEKFVDEGGVEVALGVIKRSKKFREAALGMLDFGCMGSRRAVGRIFESYGIGILFAVLSSLEGEGVREGEMKVVAERLLGLLFAMLRYGDDQERDRIMKKMREGSKVLIIVRLYLWFREDIEVDVLDESLEKRLLVLQMGATVLGHVVAEGDQVLREGVLRVLKDVNIELDEILTRCKEYVEGIEGGEEKEREGERIERLVEEVKTKTKTKTSGDHNVQ